MKHLLRLLIFIIPICIFSFFYAYLSKDNFYPGADYNNFNIPSFELNNLYEEKSLIENDLEATI